MARARKFYEEVIGLKDGVSSEGGEGSWIEYSVGEATFSLGKMEDFHPSSSGANIAFEVEDFDKFVGSLREQGIVFKMNPLETSVCHMALIEDTEGNTVIIHKRKT
jgi:predicted enzyme related to lactoylglutathione lyase